MVEKRSNKQMDIACSHLQVLLYFSANYHDVKCDNPLHLSSTFICL